VRRLSADIKARHWRDVGQRLHRVVPEDQRLDLSRCRVAAGAGAVHRSGVGDSDMHNVAGTQAET